ncbi:microfibril-associated glycoprotein 4-like [Mytilus edulis]|uniref:microfibril-associated glycoprotein 4-like n=1 Tax=Mytilus edulis TaxID=6550 RepID=UPI0039F0D0A1
MEYYWRYNSIIIVVAFCVPWYGITSVTAFKSDTKDIGNEDPLSIPLIDDKGAPLVAMLDTNTINRNIKVYIKTLMKNMIQSSMQEQFEGTFKISLEKNSTIDFIKNITLQEINNVVKEQGQEKLLNEGMSPPAVVKYKDCSDLKKKTMKILNDGVYSIYPGGDKPVQAYCDMTTDGGGWTVMLKRFGGSVDFRRTWVECENGFGDIHGDFWLGNKYTHMLTSTEKYELRVDMVDTNSNETYAVYKTFIIGDAASKYKLTVGDYSGNAGDHLIFHNKMKFSTFDQDNDRARTNCALAHTGSWWYRACFQCDLSRTDSPPFWTNTLSTAVMMIRKI